MTGDLPYSTIYDLLVGDFQTGWDSLAANPTADNRGNFMFACQAMILLEFVSRLCKNDPSALSSFARALHAIDNRYFTLLLGPCASTRDFNLPTMGSQGDRELLAVLFDLIRNGQTHQYQQAIVKLNGGDFVVSLTGSVPGAFLSAIQAAGRPPDHLCYKLTATGDLILKVRTDWLFLDFKLAIQNSGILSRGLRFDYVLRPKPGSTYYQFTSQALESSLANAGHQRC